MTARRAARIIYPLVYMPLWAGLSNNEIPVEPGKLLTNQDYGGDAKKCMDNVASLIDKAVADAGL